MGDCRVKRIYLGIVEPWKSQSFIIILFMIMCYIFQISWNLTVVCEPNPFWTKRNGCLWLRYVHDTCTFYCPRVTRRIVLPHIKALFKFGFLKRLAESTTANLLCYIPWFICVHDYLVINRRFQALCRKSFGPNSQIVKWLFSPFFNKRNNAFSLHTSIRQTSKAHIFSGLKFCEIVILLLSYVVPVKIKVKISQNFLAFSGYMNFNIKEIPSSMSTGRG